MHAIHFFTNQGTSGFQSRHRIATLAALFLLLVGCGGGGGGGSNNDSSSAPANSAPTDLVLSSTEVAEKTPGATVGTLITSDPNEEDQFTLEIVADPDDWFEIAGTQLKLREGRYADRSAAAMLRVTVRTTDEGGLSLEKTLEVDVTALAEDAPGLISRPQNTTCVAPGRPDKGIRIGLERAFPELGFRRPIALMQAPGDASRWFVVERAGRVMAFDNDEQTSNSEVFVDITDRVDFSYAELGLLGMAFHPDFAHNHQVFLSYTGPAAPYVSHISRFTSPDGGHTLDPNSEVVILSLDQPAKYHNGGEITFGPDGYLYIGFGEGGGKGAQNTEDLFGAILRIDVNQPGDDGRAYSIPADNPFAMGGGRPELYAWGLRNPWRWSFDRDSGELWAGDVGDDSWEEIDRVQRGGNYGFEYREGPDCKRNPECNRPGLIDPVVAYSHAEGCSVIGGYVYRGTEIPGLNGTYVFSDFCAGRVFGIVYDQEGKPGISALAETGFPISTFGEANDGELLVTNFDDGTLYRIVPGEPPADDEFPRLLSQTGCFDPQDPTQPEPGLIPYDINLTFWSDGADKERWLAIPDGTSIELLPDGNWAFPVGSVVIKSFLLSGKLIETRLLVRHADGGWGGYSYEWNDEQTDATLVEGGKVRSFGDVHWIYPSSSQCAQCHTEAAGRVLGPETVQMNRRFEYPQTGRNANQMHTYDEIGLYLKPLGPDPEDDLPKLVDAYDDSNDLHARARSYLHANCAQCHVKDSIVYNTLTRMDFDFFTADADMKVCDREPQHGTLGIENARIIAPGDPQRSVLLQRISRRDAYAMPPVGSDVVDQAGARLIEEWIRSLDGCP